MKLSGLKIGESGKVVKILCIEDVRKRLLNMGLSEGVTVKLIRKAPLNCPLMIKVRDLSLALRVSEADNIWVEV